MTAAAANGVCFVVYYCYDRWTYFVVIICTLSWILIQLRCIL